MAVLTTRPLVSVRYLEHQIGIDRKRLEELASRAATFYRPFDREKAPASEKWRHIDNPEEPLKSIQRRISRRVFRDIHLPEELTGGLAGRSIADNARPHVGQSTIVSLDLESYFPHINNDRVYEALVVNLGCSSETAGLLTRLSTFQRRLPQGSPASSFLANLVMVKALASMKVVANDFGINITCFVDDIALSGERADDAIGPIISILAQHGLTVSRSKLNIARQNEERTVTGAGASRRLTVPRRKLKEIQAFLGTLAAKERVSCQELSRARGYVNFAENLNASQGAYLRRRLIRLPEVGDDEIAPAKKTRTRSCRSFTRRH